MDLLVIALLAPAVAPLAAWPQAAGAVRLPLELGFGQRFYICRQKR